MRGYCKDKCYFHNALNSPGNVNFVPASSAKLLHLSALVLDKIVMQNCNFLSLAISGLIHLRASHMWEQGQTLSMRRMWAEVPYKYIQVFFHRKEKKNNSHH